LKEDRAKKQLVFALVAFAAATAASDVFAMHIAEGFLPLFWVIVWFACYLPFLAWGIVSVNKKTKDSSRLKIILAMCGAFCFVLSALKIPSVAGSSSHPTGVGLGTVLFGPASMAFIGFIVLLFQALLLAHGGLTTLGANGFSMAVAGPFAGYAVYLLANKLKCPRPVSVFLAAFVADLSTYAVTSTQLALAFNNDAVGFSQSLLEFMALFAVPQIPLAIIEGILTVMVYSAINSLCEQEVSLLTGLGGKAK
jgi:cobalt/nickel transport system permease protein